MKRTTEDIRDNLSFVGCDNETALEMCEEIERLRAIMDRLPKTADGVPIVAGMELWRVRADVVIHRFAMISDVDVEGSDPATLCYSTREAAEKARE